MLLQAYRSKLDMNIYCLRHRVLKINFHNLLDKDKCVVLIKMASRCFSLILGISYD